MIFVSVIEYNCHIIYTRRDINNSSCLNTTSTNTRFWSSHWSMYSVTTEGLKDRSLDKSQIHLVWEQKNHNLLMHSKYKRQQIHDSTAGTKQLSH